MQVPSKQERQSETDRPHWTSSYNNFSWEIIPGNFSLLCLSLVSMALAYFCKIQCNSSCDFCALSGLGTDGTVFLASLYYRRQTNVCLLLLAVIHVPSLKNKKAFNVAERSQVGVKGILFPIFLYTTFWNSSSHVSLLIEFFRFFEHRKYPKRMPLK